MYLHAIFDYTAVNHRQLIIRHRQTFRSQKAQCHHVKSLEGRRSMLSTVIKLVLNAVVAWIAGLIFVSANL